MQRPKHKFNSPGLIPKMTPNLLPDPQLDPVAFEELIRNRGIRFRLDKSSYCPNVKDLDGRIHSPDCKICFNGLIYYTSCEIRGIFQQGKYERLQEIVGGWSIGEAVVTFSAYTDSPEGEIGKGVPIDVRPFDRLTALDYSFRHTQLVEHSITGVDRLRYPALSVEFISTASKRYYPDSDFVINPDGHIKWLTQSQPSFDQVASRGEIYTISYTARSSYIVVNNLHESRWTTGYDPVTNEQSAILLPQMSLIRRVHLFFNMDTHEPPLPRDGGNLPPR